MLEVPWCSVYRLFSVDKQLQQPSQSMDVRHQKWWRLVNPLTSKQRFRVQDVESLPIWSDNVFERTISSYRGSRGLDGQIMAIQPRICVERLAKISDMWNIRSNPAFFFKRWLKHGQFDIIRPWDRQNRQTEVLGAEFPGLPALWPGLPSLQLH